MKSDFIGFIPQLRILEETRYKSIFSSLLSIALIIFSVVFTFYSFVDYLNQFPEVPYYKSNDNKTNKVYTINNSLLMFNYYFYCISNFSEEHHFTATTYDFRDLTNDGEKIVNNIEYEPCSLNENLDIKYKDIIEKFESIESTKLNEFFCLNFHGEDFTLFNNPNIFSDFENYLQFKIESKCEDYFLIFHLVTENDFIEHTNKDNPIVPYYQHHKINSYKQENLELYYNYIKYESDDGFIFSNKKIINGIGVSNSDSIDTNELIDEVLRIRFKMNGASYDYYQRKYIKFQGFLADVTSLINLLITISKVLSEFLLYKKMHKDIIRYIMSSNKIKKNNNILIQSHKIFNTNINLEKIKTEKKEIENQNFESPRLTTSFNEEKLDNNLESKIKNEKINNVMKNLKVNSIIKSFFCCKDKKTKIINLCDKIVEKDICVERILKRIYLIENEFDIFKNEYFSEIKNNIDDINNELNMKMNNNTQKTLNQNNKVK